MFGAGYLEMLARQMTSNLQTIRDSLKLGESKPLVSKGVSFGWLTRQKDGSWDTSRVEGLPRASIIAPTPVDRPTLILRPWHQASNVVSLREFTNTAFNQHHGMQSTERFGLDTDADGDGVKNELTVGDITSIVLFQAQLGTPGRKLPEDPVRRKGAEEGEGLFNGIGCAECHVPEMRLKTRMFTEANPFNPEWKLLTTVAKPVGFDMTMQGQAPRLEASPDGGAIVRAYTDLKRHNLCDAGDRFFCNDKLSEAGIPLGEFVTRKLWDIGSSAAFGHRGDLSTITEAIEHHAGEARAARNKYSSLSPYSQRAVVEFLKTLQILPPK